MCKLKSVIILKDSIFCPGYDSHTDMLRELKIKDTKKNAERLFVRAELSPENGDIFSDVETWKMKVDQDIIPEWFVEEAEKPRVIKAVKEWAEKAIFEDKHDLTLDENKAYYLKNSTATLCGNSTATLYGNSTAELCGNSKATLWGKSVGIIPSYSLSDAEKSTVAGGAVLIDKRCKRIITAGDYELVKRSAGC